MLAPAYGKEALSVTHEWDESPHYLMSLSSDERLAGHEPGARPLLGDRVRLASVRRETERAPRLSQWGGMRMSVYAREELAE